MQEHPTSHQDSLPGEFRDDQELIQRFLGGSNASYEALIERYEAKVFNTALHLTANQTRAEEVLHDVFSALVTHLEEDRGKTALFGWLIQYTLDRSVESLIASDRGELAPFEEHRKDFESSNADLREAIRRAAAGLAADERYVFVLRDIQGLSLEETASVLDLHIFTVRSLLYRARRTIRDRLMS